MRISTAAVLAALISNVTLPSTGGTPSFASRAFAAEAPASAAFASEPPASAVFAGAAPLSSDSAIAIAATFATAAESASDDLGPTSDPPWNPPRATLRRRVWEQAILLPQRVATLPLSALGAATDRTLLFLEDRNVIERFAFVSREIPRRTGMQLRLASLGDRTGFGGKIEARTTFLQGNFRNFLTVAHSASTRNYHDTEVRFFGRPLALQYRYQWRPQERFYGLGMDTGEDDRAQYAVHIEQVLGSLGAYWNRNEAEQEEPRTELSIWLGPRTIVTRNGREEGEPSIETRYAALIAPTLHETYEQMTYGVRFASDWRMGRPRWFEGWRVLLQSERFDEPWSILGLRTGRAGAQFTRTHLELEGAQSFGVDPRTFRFMGRVIDQGIGAGRERMEIFDLMNLGGREGLRGFQPGRFHDVDLVLARLTYVFTLVRRFEMDLHVESGGVFTDVWRTTRLDRFEQSFGFAFRGRTNRRPIGSLGVDFSREGARIRYSLGNPDR